MQDIVWDIRKHPRYTAVKFVINGNKVYNRELYEKLATTIVPDTFVVAFSKTIPTSIIPDLETGKGSIYDILVDIYQHLKIEIPFTMLNDVSLTRGKVYIKSWELLMPNIYFRGIRWDEETKRNLAILSKD
jgi:hypothetical protein